MTAPPKTGQIRKNRPEIDANNPHDPSKNRGLHTYCTRELLRSVTRLNEPHTAVPCREMLAVPCAASALAVFSERGDGQ